MTIPKTSTLLQNHVKVIHTRVSHLYSTLRIYLYPSPVSLYPTVLIFCTQLVHYGVVRSFFSCQAIFSLLIRTPYLEFARYSDYETHTLVRIEVASSHALPHTFMSNVNKEYSTFKSCYESSILTFHRHCELFISPVTQTFQKKILYNSLIKFFTTRWRKSRKFITVCTK